MGKMKKSGDYADKTFASLSNIRMCISKAVLHGKKAESEKIKRLAWLKRASLLKKKLESSKK